MRCAVVVCLALALAAPARAGVDLRDVRPVGVAGSDAAELAAVGDVNGDGAADVAVGMQDDRRTRDAAALNEIAVVAFGPAPPDPARPGFAGLVLSHLDEPALEDDRGRVSFGRAVGGDVVGVGDWDGDGLDDVAVGAAGAGPHRRPNAGSVYVVLGRGASGAVDVRSDPGVVRIDGPVRAGEVGRTLGAAGDFDGDGRPDLAIALPGERVVIVRGGLPAGTRLDLARPPAGSTIELRGVDGGKAPPSRGPSPGRAPEAASFAAVGDVDGDGRGELAVGVPVANPPRGRAKVLVVRGAAPGAVVDVAERRSLIARVVGPRTRPDFGGQVATMPDVDGDGLPEWVIGTALGAGHFLFIVGGPPDDASVVFSRARGRVVADRAGQPVVTVATGGIAAARAVAGIPDATGDGVPDLLVGLPDASPLCRSKAGAIALVAGRRTPGRVRVGARAPRIDGAAVGGQIGESIAVSASDVFLGARPFANAASLDLWRVPFTALARPSPPLPASRDCLSVTIVKRSRAQLRRAGVVRAVVRSDAGDGRRHRLRLRAELYNRRTFLRGPGRILTLPRAGRRRVTLPLPRRASEFLAGHGSVIVAVSAEQRVGSGSRATSGAFGGDVIPFRRR